MPRWAHQYIHPDWVFRKRSMSETGQRRQVNQSIQEGAETFLHYSHVSNHFESSNGKENWRHLNGCWSFPRIGWLIPPSTAQQLDSSDLITYHQIPARLPADPGPSWLVACSGGTGPEGPPSFIECGTTAAVVMHRNRGPLVSPRTGSHHPRPRNHVLVSHLASHFSPLVLIRPSDDSRPLHPLQIGLILKWRAIKLKTSALRSCTK